ADPPFLLRASGSAASGAFRTATWLLLPPEDQRVRRAKIGARALCGVVERDRHQRARRGLERTDACALDYSRRLRQRSVRGRRDRYTRDALGRELMLGRLGCQGIGAAEESELQ